MTVCKLTQFALITLVLAILYGIAAHLYIQAGARRDVRAVASQYRDPHTRSTP